MTWVAWLGLYLGIGFLIAVVVFGTLVWLGLWESKEIPDKLYVGFHIVMGWPYLILWTVWFLVSDAFIETFLEGGRP